MISGKFRMKKNGLPYSECVCTHPELIENYDRAIADTDNQLVCHHRLETHNSDGERRLVDLSKDELIAFGMYFNRPPEELIFLTAKEHSNIHRFGKTRSEEVKSKISATKLGHTVDNETRKKISKTLQKFYYKCVENGEIHTHKEWCKLGYYHVCSVASGKRNSCGGLHFIRY